MPAETPLTGRTKSGKILTEQEELFCNLYVTTYNRVESALGAYDIDRSKKNWRYTASSIAYENLLKPYLNERIRELLDTQTLTDEVVDNELAFLLQQNAELPVKKGAIDIFNRLKGRYEKDNLQKAVTVQIQNYAETQQEDNNAPSQLPAATVSDTIAESS